MERATNAPLQRGIMYSNGTAANFDAIQDQVVVLATSGQHTLIDTHLSIM